MMAAGDTHRKRHILSPVLPHLSNNPDVLSGDAWPDEGSGVVLIDHAAGDTPVHLRSIRTSDNVHAKGL